jgi:hypothetical protein
LVVARGLGRRGHEQAQGKNRHHSVTHMTPVRCPLCLFRHISEGVASLDVSGQV